MINLSPSKTVASLYEILTELVQRNAVLNQEETLFSCISLSSFMFLWESNSLTKQMGLLIYFDSRLLRTIFISVLR